MIPPAGRSFAKNQATRAKMVSWVVLDHPGRIGSETMSHVAEIMEHGNARPGDARPAPVHTRR